MKSVYQLYFFISVFFSEYISKKCVTLNPFCAIFDHNILGMDPVYLSYCQSAEQLVGQIWLNSTKTEEQNTIALDLEKIKYHGHQLVIDVNLKMVNSLLGQQSDQSKYP